MSRSEKCVPIPERERRSGYGDDNGDDNGDDYGDDYCSLVGCHQVDAEIGDFDELGPVPHDTFAVGG